MDLNQDLVIVQLRFWHIAEPCGAPIAIDGCMLHDIFATGAASSRRSFRIPASTRPAGANLRSNCRRPATPPAV
jgi:hypothetical protein